MPEQVVRPDLAEIEDKALYLTSSPDFREKVIALSAYARHLENEIHEWEESDKAGPAFTDIIDEQTKRIASLESALSASQDAVRVLREALVTVSMQFNDMGEILSGRDSDAATNAIHSALASTATPEPAQQEGQCSAS